MAKTKTPKNFRILSCDGGGIRGVITAVWLAALEKKLGKPLTQCFDLVAGTSTGSILAAAITAGIPASQMVQLYLDHGREIFPSTAGMLWNRLGRTFTQGVSAPKYSDAGLGRILQSTFKDITLGQLASTKDSRLPVLLIVTYNVLTRQSIVFKSTKPLYDSLPVWEIVKASCSAPTYFPAHILRHEGAQIPLIDGGVVANNPTACAIAEAVRINADIKPKSASSKLDDFIVASLGTGQTTRAISISEAREWGALEWAVPVIDVLFDGASDATDYISSYLLPDDRYFRLQTQLDQAYDDIDNASSTNINALIAIANRHLQSEDGDKKLTALAKLL